jgi:predicted Zn-dependent protease
MGVFRFLTLALVAVTVAVAAPAASKEPEEGVKIKNIGIVGKAVRWLQSPETMEQIGEKQYAQMRSQASQKGALLPPDHPQSQRLRKIFEDLLPHSYKFNERARDWKWEVSVFNSPQVNAFCMPGGKIAFFTGILQKIQLTDDEAAMVMGHEIAHALREHSRARAAKEKLTQFGTIAISVLVGGNAGEIARMGGGLLGLRFSRGDETEADLIGMELAARAGYDPSSGIKLWEKMSAANKGAPMEFMSTHPSGTTRISTIKANLKDVMPLYERAKAKKGLN